MKLTAAARKKMCIRDRQNRGRREVLCPQGNQGSSLLSQDDYVERLKSHFFPMEGLKAVFRIDLVEEKSSLIIDINDSKLNCYRGTVEQADVTAKVKTAVFKQVLDGTKTFQSAFMSGELSAQGNFKILRNFDTIFRFQNI